MGLAILLGLPTLGIGLVADDLLQRLVLLGEWPFGSGEGPVWDLFAFIPGSTTGVGRELELGILPWWADPEVTASFFRPVTVATHVLDYALWPDQFWLQHLHNLIWYAGSVGITVVCFRRFGLALPLVGLAGLMFALEDAHAIAMGWLANRNALICLVFGVGSMCLHQRWRTEGRWAFGIASVVCFSLSLLAAEAGVGALAYLVSWQLFMEEKTWGARARGLLPYLLVLLVWLLYYQHLGFGVRWSDMYVDPGQQPVRFLVASVERLPLMLAAQWFQFPSDVSILLGFWGRVGFAALAWALCLLLLRWLWPLLRARRQARFWGMGMMLSLVPICAAFPMNRVLTFTGLGAFALLALQLEPWLEGREHLTGFQRLLLFLHIPFSAVGLLIGPFLWFGGMDVLLPSRDLPEDVRPEETLVLLQTHELAGCSLSFNPVVEGLTDRPIPVAMLASLLTDLRVERVDDHTLEIRAEGGWNRLPVERFTRSTQRPWRAGETVSMARYLVQIMEVTEDGRPLRVRFRFDANLEDPTFRWFVYEGLRLVEWQPLPVGETQQLPSVAF